MERYNSIEIQYNPIIDDEVIDDFISDSDIMRATRNLISTDYDHFDGETLSAIVLYINSHQTELFVDNVLFPVFIAGLKKLLKKISTTINPVIDINFIDNDLDVGFEIKGSKQESIDNTVDKFVEYMKFKTYLKYSAEKKYLQADTVKPRIRFRYNANTKKYEPVDVEALAKLMDKWKRDAEDSNG